MWCLCSVYVIYVVCVCGTQVYMCYGVVCSVYDVCGACVWCVCYLCSTQVYMCAVCVICVVCVVNAIVLLF